MKTYIYELILDSNPSGEFVRLEASDTDDLSNIKQGVAQEYISNNKAYSVGFRFIGLNED